MQATAIIEVLSRALSADAARFEAVESRDGMPTFYVSLRLLVETCRVLRDAPELRFVFMADVTAVDYHPRDPRFEIALHPGVPGRGRLRRDAEAAAAESAGARGNARAVGVEHLAVGELGRARSVRFLRPALRRPSRHAPDSDARRLGRVSDAQGLPGPDQPAGEDLRAAAGVGGRVRGQHGGGAARGTDPARSRAARTPARQD